MKKSRYTDEQGAFALRQAENSRECLAIAVRQHIRGEDFTRTMEG